MLLSSGRDGAAPSLPVPRVPEPATASPFPVLATVAPVMGSVLLWAVTGSPFALVFALLGPVIAIASVGDSRMTVRRRGREENARFARECDLTSQAISAAQLREVESLRALAPGPQTILRAAQTGPRAWRADITADLPVAIGEGTQRSSVVLRVDPLVDARPTDRERLDALAEQARVIHHAPVVVDARLRIGVVGPPVLATAAVRGVTVQLAAVLSPATTSLAVFESGTAEGEWMRALPHPRPPRPLPAAPRVMTVVFGANDRRTPEVTVAAAETPEALPPGTGVVLRVTPTAEIVSDPEAARLGELRPLFVSHREMVVWAWAQRRLAAAAGMHVVATDLPSRVALAELLGLSPPDAVRAGRRGLAAAMGLGADGPEWVDLVSDGPHAIVGGTTGSGKSELLVSWVLAMASTYPPGEVTFLFVDFKGGAAFDPLGSLPHSVGVITDLDTREVLRALSSLRAEVRYRERVLAGSGLRSIADAAGPLPVPRLVLVVDEYAALVEEHPQLQPLIADLCARGRSLGIHLVLCTQRPSGVVRDGILANCGLRISLRVHDRADSVSVLGTPAASELPTLPVGRAIIAELGGTTRLVQVAAASPDDAAETAGRWQSSPLPRRPWRPPLPAVVSDADLATAEPTADELADTAQGLPFGLVDLPQEQRRAVAMLKPADGSVLVVGASGAGKTGVLHALAARAGRVGAQTVAPTLPAVWDAASAALAATDGAQRLLLLDDIDAVLASCPDDYATALGELLYRVLREGPRRGVTCVLTAQRLTGPLHSLAGLCGSTVLLRMPSLQEHVAASGRPEDWDPTLPPGAGTWRGRRIQVLATASLPPAASEHRTGTVDARQRGVLAVVSTRPRQLTETLRRAGRTVLPMGDHGHTPELTAATGDSAIVVGDPDAWVGRWGALAALRESSDVFFDGCSTAEFRTLTGLRELPPPVGVDERTGWLLRPDGSITRATLDIG
ncbi:MAG: FtsK/SpoIIIE domain-containing protein [Glaciihabitans sp.]